MNLPRVLIIGQSFCDFRGGGITMRNLFSQWQKDKIAVACTPYYLTLKLNTAVCDNYYQLGEKEYKFRFPFSLIQKNAVSGPVRFSSSPSEKNFVSPGIRHKLVHNVVYPFMEYTGLIHNLSRIELSEPFCTWLKEYDPEIIYAQAYSMEGVRFAIAVQAFLKKPMAFHMMDDWPSSSGDKGPLSKYWTKKIDSAFRMLLNKSSPLLSISEAMSDEYKRRYGKHFTAFHNPIDIEFWKKFQKHTYELNATPYILYSGRIGLGIDSSLELIAGAVDKVNAESGLAIKFILSAEEKPGWLNKYQCAEHKNFVAYEDVPKTLSAADVLVLPYDFSPESIKFIKYSMPTKASEYMMSGTPVLLFAPPGTAIVNYADKYRCFETVTDNSLDSLVKAIKKLFTDIDLRRQMAVRGAALAEQKHNAEKITTAFNELLCSAVHDPEKEYAQRQFTE